MNLKFTKMHGLGNDFMVVDGIRQAANLTTDLIRQWGHRQFGIGFDQLLLVKTPTACDHDFSYHIFNNNGIEVEQCGNGARCFVKFVHDQALTQKQCIRAKTTKEIITLEYLPPDAARVEMGIPRFNPDALPFTADEACLTYWLTLPDGTALPISTVSIGNPHAVHIVDQLDDTPVACWGAAIEQHPRFPKRVNAGFMQIIAPNQIRLRVYERGVGETLACGTGACAAVVVGIRLGLLQQTVQVKTRGGLLTVSWQGEKTPVIMTGPAITVFQGEVALDTQEPPYEG